MQTEIRIKTIINREQVEIDFTVELSRTRSKDTFQEEFYWEVDSVNVLDWHTDEDVNDEAVEDWLELNTDRIEEAARHA
jgi:hypothetical protein